MKEFDTKKLFTPGKGHEKIIKKIPELKRIAPDGCYDYNDLPANSLFLDTEFEKKLIKTNKKTDKLK